MLLACTPPSKKSLRHTSPHHLPAENDPSSAAALSLSSPSSPCSAFSSLPPLTSLLSARFSNDTYVLSHLHALLRRRLALACRGALHGPLSLLHSSQNHAERSSQSRGNLTAGERTNDEGHSPNKDREQRQPSPFKTPPRAILAEQRERRRSGMTTSPLDHWKSTASRVCSSSSPVGDTGCKDSAGATDSSSSLLPGRNHDKRLPSEREEPPIEQVATELARKLTCCLQLKEKSSVLILGPPGSGKTAALELALNTVQQLAIKQREQRRRESSSNYSITSDARGVHMQSTSPTRSRVCTARHEDKENEEHFTSSSKQKSSPSPLRQGSVSCVSSPARSSSPPLVCTPSKKDIFENTSETLLPDLLVVRLCCPLFKDDASLLHAIVAKLAQELHCQEIPPPSASVEELSETLKNILVTSCSVVSRAVVIVLDQFEVCCLDTGPGGGFGGGGGRGGWGGVRRQQLLYNLFDLQHGHNLQICTVCISSVLDITQHMEKRIRSRFSLQTLYLGGPRTFADLEDFVRHKLLSISPALLLQYARKHEEGNTEMLLTAALERDQDDADRKKGKIRRGGHAVSEAGRGNSKRSRGRDRKDKQEGQQDEEEVEESFSSPSTKKGRDCAHIFANHHERKVPSIAFDRNKNFLVSRPHNNILLPSGICCWEPSQEDWHLAQVFTASWERAMDEEFSSRSFRKAFFAHFTMGRSPRWIFSEIIDSLLSITPPGLEDEIDGLVRTASLSVQGGKNKIDSATASPFSSPYRAALTSPLSSSKSMETAVSSPHREADERFVAPSSPRKSSMASDLKAIQEAVTPPHPSKALKPPDQRWLSSDEQRVSPSTQSYHTPPRTLGPFSPIVDTSSSPHSVSQHTPLTKDCLSHVSRTSRSPHSGRKTGGNGSSTEFGRLCGGLFKSLQTKEIFKDFSLLEHYVLGAVARLHQQSRGPKCFYMIVEQISRLYSNPHMKHQEQSVDGVRRAFIRLVDAGLLQLCNFSLQHVGYTGIASDFLGSYVPCKFPLHDAYVRILPDLEIPQAVKDWIRAVEFQDT
ncbi:origin recognition complex [Cystoisospora suis]|uniref:Origin recognition complex n=1 Tax=Cystoisospora suis TaxID=483139 RepID=A0A2C6LBA0_9APIC|nr:origin recognition complex [Cystoisospora suis]